MYECGDSGTNQAKNQQGQPTGLFAKDIQNFNRGPTS